MLFTRALLPALSASAQTHTPMMSLSNDALMSYAAAGSEAFVPSEVMQFEGIAHAYTLSFCLLAPIAFAMFMGGQLRTQHQATRLRQHEHMKLPQISQPPSLAEQVASNLTEEEKLAALCQTLVGCEAAALPSRSSALLLVQAAARAHGLLHDDDDVTAGALLQKTYVEVYRASFEGPDAPAHGGSLYA